MLACGSRRLRRYDTAFIPLALQRNDAALAAGAAAGTLAMVLDAHHAEIETRLDRLKLERLLAETSVDRLLAVASACDAATGLSKEKHDPSNDLGAVALVALVAAGWGLYALGEIQGTRAAARTSPQGVTANDATPGSASEQGSGAGKKILYYHDPMVPGTKFDKPGKSPFMDMQLVPVYDEGGAAGNGKDAGGITINPRAQQNLGIRTAEVVTGTLARGSRPWAAWRGTSATLRSSRRAPTVMSKSSMPVPCSTRS